MGRLDEAASEFRKALAIDLFSPIINMNYGVTFSMQRKYSEAVDQIRKALELQPDFRPAHRRLSEMYVTQGDYRNASVEWTKAFKTFVPPAAPDRESFGRAMLKFDEAETAAGDKSPAWVEAWPHILLGEKDKAFTELQESCTDEDDLEPMYVRSPIYDPLRSDPRWPALLKCLGEPD